jgi:hypothetical protein
MTYLYKTGKDGLVRHTPCWYTKVMQTCSEGITNEGNILKEIHMLEKKGEKVEPELKESTRWFLNHFKGGLKDAQRSYEDFCVGQRECHEENLLL